MPTYTQIAKNSSRRKKKHSKAAPDLMGNPQCKGSCIQILIKTPRKPSSGKRKIARVQLRKKKILIVIYQV